jgi:peroxiredoxin
MAHSQANLPQGALGLPIPKILLLLFAAAGLCHPPALFAQQRQTVWSDREKPINDQLRTLRDVPDDARTAATKRLAIQIRELPASEGKIMLAGGLAHLATEGDPGKGTLQDVAATLAQALREQPVAGKNGEPAEPYVELAQLVRYERVQASVDDPQFPAAMAKLEADDKARQSASFALTDLKGKSWDLRDLGGKVVLLNFWATWCPPCRKEMPDMEALYQRFAPRGLVILAISDEEAAKVETFIAEQGFSFPVLLDPGNKVNDLFRIGSIPYSFLYNREGKLVAQAIDMRTRKQFLEMLARVGLE